LITEKSKINDLTDFKATYNVNSILMNNLIILYQSLGVFKI
jgi:hypothetical protein